MREQFCVVNSLAAAVNELARPVERVWLRRVESARRSSPLFITSTVRELLSSARCPPCPAVFGLSSVTYFSDRGLMKFRLGWLIAIAMLSAARLSAQTSVQYLVVGGGGMGGDANGGGGGGGGVVVGTDSLALGSYAITIGGGGSSSSGNGGNSTFQGVSSHLAIGGGAGGAGQSGAGSAGGSGGGGGANWGPWGGGSGSAGQGNNGGTAFADQGVQGGGGGGGAGAVGANAPSGGGAGAGGTGYPSAISGTSLYYGGGGGGAGQQSSGAGGAGGGGAGNGNGGTSGTNGYGGGGGAAWGNGGSGVVILRYLTSSAVVSTGGTKTTDGSYTVHTFTSNGTFTLAAAPPTLTAISPTSGNQGTSSLPVTVTGTNFIAGAQVSLDNASGITIGTVNVVSTTRIDTTFSISSTAPTTSRNVLVTTSGGSTPTPQSFTVTLPTPVLTSITPTGGTQGTYVDVTLNGSYFVAGATSVVPSSNSGLTVVSVSVSSSTQAVARVFVDLYAPVGSPTLGVATPSGPSGTQTFSVTGAAASAGYFAKYDSSGMLGTSALREDGSALTYTSDFFTPNLVLNSTYAPTGSTVGGRLDLRLVGGPTKYGLAGDVPGAIWWVAQANDVSYGAAAIQAVIAGGGNAASTAHTADLSFFTKRSGNSAATEAMRITHGGNIGIGTINPSAKLHVAGDVVVDGNIGAKYQDVAEWVNVTEALEPGTIVIIDPNAANRVSASDHSYDTHVAGAVSSRPGLALGEASSDKALIAQSGRVRVKVDASFGPIRPGDLLVTSPTPGFAMRSQPVEIDGVQIHRTGTVLGKALESLESGRGEILALITLQ